MPHTVSRWIFVVIFLISGLSGLIYESIWTHYLKLFLGHAAYAQTLVLAIFMGGMAIGAFLCGKHIQRWGKLILYYAYVEAVIGIAALVFHPLFVQFVDISFNQIIPALNNPSVINSYKWFAAALLVLPQSILLGMTFPLLTAGIVRLYPGKAGETISLLYFSNSLGGAIGVLLSGFLLIKTYGLPGTMMMAGSLNILLAVVVIALVKRYALTREAVVIKSDESLPFNESIDSKALLKPEPPVQLFLFIAFFTGVASFMYELGWIRMLNHVLSSSTHAFELMLSAFIFGLALGGLWIYKRIETIDSVLYLGALQIAMGLSALLSLFFFTYTVDISSWLVSNLEKTDTGYWLYNLGSEGIAFLIMLPATFCAGTTLPLITFTLLKRQHSEAGIGYVYGVNTVGAILGILLVTHIGFTLVGLKGVLLTGAFVDIGLGLLILWYYVFDRQFRSRGFQLTVGLCITAFLIIAFGVELNKLDMASGVFRTGKVLDPNNTKILQTIHGKTSSISMHSLDDKVLVLSTNGKPDAALTMAEEDRYKNPDESTMILMAAITMLLKPDAKTVANIGMGSGLTTHVLLSTNQLEKVDTIEIEQAVVEVAKKFYPRNRFAYEDNRSIITIEDAKTYFSSQKTRYDIIMSEPSNPWVSGVSGLFSREFYQHIKRYLKSDGVFVQWLQLYEIDQDVVSSVFKSVAAEFGDFVVYAPTFGDILIFANNNGDKLTLTNSLIDDPRFIAELASIHVKQIQDISIRYVGNKNTLMPLMNSYSLPANTDYYPVIDQHVAKTLFLKKSALPLTTLTKQPLPVLELLGDSIEPPEVTNVEAVGVFPKSIDVRSAQLIRDNIINGGLISRQHGQLRGVSDAIMSLFEHCERRPNHGDRVFVLMALATKTLAYLSSTENAQIWNKLDAARCVLQWTAYEQTWFNFLFAVGERDAKSMSILSQRLLIAPEPTTLTRKKYLVAASMLSAIATNNRALATKNWQRYRDDIYPNNEPANLLFRLLLQHSTL